MLFSFLESEVRTKRKRLLISLIFTLCNGSNRIRTHVNSTVVNKPLLLVQSFNLRNKHILVFCTGLSGLSLLMYAVKELDILLSNRHDHGKDL